MFSNNVQQFENAKYLIILLPFWFNTLYTVQTNTEHVQGLGANGKAAFSPKAHG